MPTTAADPDIEALYGILDAVGAIIDDLYEQELVANRAQKILRQWLTGHGGAPDDFAAKQCLVAMASELEAFTPSATGQTLIERHLKRWQAQTPVDQAALAALHAARFRLVRVVGRAGPDQVELRDLVSGEMLILLDALIAPEAAGIDTAMRLCPLGDGFHAVISPLFAMDQAMLDDALTFVRPGRPLGHRCVASLYRNVARRGFIAMPQVDDTVDPEDLEALIESLQKNLSPVKRLVMAWVIDAAYEDELIAETRQMADVENAVDVFGALAEMDGSEPAGLQEAHERIAAIFIETLALRAHSGLSHAVDALDQIAARIAGFIAQDKMDPQAGLLFEQFRARHGAKVSDKTASADIDRVIERIRALRARTVEHGCTEAEAMAAAAKVSELLARHDITLDEVAVRRSECEGISVTTGRKRRSPIDGCMNTIARFCDCRVWSETARDGNVHYVFFGLRGDVAAAHFLYDLILDTFESESAAFRAGKIYHEAGSGQRRTALNSFQYGLASGIAAKLDTIKQARTASTAVTTGFDLVAVKTSVVDDEIDRLGLNLTAKTSQSRRRVNPGAFAAGQIAGSRFEPDAALPG